MRSAWVIVVSVLLSLWAMLHAYVGWRLLGGDRIGVVLTGLGWGALGASFVLTPVVFGAMRSAGGRWAERTGRVGWTLFGWFSILVTLLIARDVLGTVLVWLDVFTDPARLASVSDGMDLAVAVLSVVLAAAAVSGGRASARVQSVEVPIRALDPVLDGFRVVQISDVHVGATVGRARVAELVESANGLGPDVIAVTGDLADGRVGRLRDAVAPLAGLEPRHGTYFVTGNHEYYSGVDAWCAECRRLGMRVLLDEHVVLEHDGVLVVLGGVTDPSGLHFSPDHRSDPVRAMQGAPSATARILLAHQPRGAARAAAAGWDVQLSGHTHGGQYFPFTWLVHAFQRHVAGLYRVGSMWLYVNRGAAHWGPPLRLGSPQEITLLTLRRA